MSKIEVEFKFRRKRESSGASESDIIGVFRGLEKARDVTFIGAIEHDTTEKSYVVTVEMDEKHYPVAKGQAESYGVVVTEIITSNHEQNS